MEHHVCYHNVVFNYGQVVHLLHMKRAISLNGKLINASETAPPVAICRYCGGKTKLRSRRRMIEEGVTYFWRHQPNVNLGCQGRRTPIK